MEPVKTNARGEVTLSPESVQAVAQAVLDGLRADAPRRRADQPNLGVTGALTRAQERASERLGKKGVR